MYKEGDYKAEDGETEKETYKREVSKTDLGKRKRKIKTAKSDLNDENTESPIAANISIYMNVYYLQRLNMYQRISN